MSIMETGADLRTTLRDLIVDGRIQVPATLYGEHGCGRFEVTLQEDGTLVGDGQTFSSLSIAAGTLITLKSRQRTPGRSYLSVNGWTFWKVRQADGTERTLAEIRKPAR